MVDKNEIENLLAQPGSNLISSLTNNVILDDESKKQFELLEKYFNDKICLKAVLGIDIYHYSQYKDTEQNIIPFILQKIIEATNKEILDNEKYLFPDGFMKNRDECEFIDTGDGGFFIFETPLHAIAYAIHFSNKIRLFNSYGMYPLLRQRIKELTIRYAISYNTIFRMNNNTYGTAIINAARILSKDKLNRLLIDENTNEWFYKYLNGIETLCMCQYEDFITFDIFHKYNKDFISREGHGAFSKRYDDTGIQIFGIMNCHVQKIGKIKAKLTEMSIYNLCMQFVYGEKTLVESKNIVNSIGNLNLSGIEIE